MAIADTDALKVRLQDYVPKLRAFAASRLRTADEVSDVVQETLLQALRHLDELREPSKLGAWIKAIARNQIADYLRYQSDKRWQKLARAAETASPDRRQVFHEQVDAVAGRLAAAYRRDSNVLVLALSLCLEWGPKEIATVLELPLNTVYTQLRRARQRMARAPSAPPDPDAWVEMKLLLVTAMWSCGRWGMLGNRYRDLHLIEEGHALASLLAAQHPDNEEVRWMAMLMAYYLAEFRGDVGLHEEFRWERDFESFHRERWDAGLKAEAERQYRGFLHCARTPWKKAMIEAMHEIFSPARNDLVRWRLVVELMRNAEALRPTLPVRSMLARAIAQLDGAKAGAKYLASFAGHREYRDAQEFWTILGKLYYQAQDWQNAARCLKRIIRMTANPAVRREYERCFRDCKARRQRAMPGRKAAVFSKP